MNDVPIGYTYQSMENGMDDLINELMKNPRVKTPMGNGVIVGSILRENWEVIVSLDEKPMAAFDKGTNPLLVWSFELGELEVLNEK